jgi:hypothetical protein
MRSPSGDQVGPVISPSSSPSRIRRLSRPRSASAITISLRPPAKTTKAICRESGDHEPEESMKRSASVCGSEAALESLRIVSPVRASARKRSKEKRSFSEM